MTYDEYTYNETAHIPSDLNCFLQDSHSAKKENKKKYLGGQTGTEKNLNVNIEVFTETDDEANQLLVWFNDDLDGGSLPFTARHTIFGREEYYVFKIIGGISEKIVSGSNRKNAFSTEVVGVAFVGFSLSSPITVLTTGGMTSGVVPTGDDRSYNTDNFSLDLGDYTDYPISSIVKTNDVLYVSPASPVREGVTAILVHTQDELGLGSFSQPFTNNSTVAKSLPTIDKYIPTNGNVIYLYLDTALGKNYEWGNTETPFSVQINGADFIPHSGSQLDRTTGISISRLEIYLDDSRPIYSGETVSVSFSDSDNPEIDTFTTSVTNNSTIPDPTANEIIGTPQVSSAGTTILASMSIPQDRTYNAFEVILDGVNYPITSAIQTASSLLVTLDFPITDFVSTVKLDHQSEEWGVVVGETNCTNNSQTGRILVSTANVPENGASITLTLTRNVSDSFEWVGGALDDITVTADGVTIPIVTSVTPSKDGSSYTIAFYGSTVKDGETVLVSYSESSNIELFGFTNTSVDNSSIIQDTMEIVSATVDSNGYTISVVMSQSDSATYTKEFFEIDHGGLPWTSETNPSQSGTSMLIYIEADLPPIRANTIVTLSHTEVEYNGFGVQLDLPVVNNSTVNAPEFVSAEVVSVGTYIILTMDESLVSQEWGVDDFIVTVEGVERTILVNPLATNGFTTIDIHIQGVIISTDTVTLEFAGTTDPQVYPFSETIANNSTQSATDDPPEYLMVEPLVSFGSYMWLENSSPSGTIYRGKLEYVGDDTGKVEGEAWTPTTGETTSDYPRDGSINLADLSDGDGSKRVNTGWIAPPSTEWVMRGVYNVVVGTSYDTYAIHYLGDGTCDIYLGSDIVDFPSTPNESAVVYTPPTTAWMIYDYPPSIIEGVEIRLETNGDFTSGTDWLKWEPVDTTITYDSGNEQYDYDAPSSADPANALLYQTIDVTENDSILLEISVSNLTAGSVGLGFIDGEMDVLGTQRTANGVYQQTVTATATATVTIQIAADYTNGFIGSVDYVKVIDNN